MADHGTKASYNQGCRCRGCTEANSAASRELRARRRAGELAEPRRALPAKVSDFAVDDEVDEVEQLTRDRSELPAYVRVPLVARLANVPRGRAPFQWSRRLPKVARVPREARQVAAGRGRQAQSAAAIDDYVRRLSYYLAYGGDSPELAAAKRAYGRR